MLMLSQKEEGITSASASSCPLPAFVFLIPAELAGFNVVLQAVDLAMCTGSNVNADAVIGRAFPGNFTGDDTVCRS